MPSADRFRYQDLLRWRVADPPRFVATVESPATVQVERAAALAAAVGGRAWDPAWFDTLAGRDPGRMAVIDGAGHRRPAFKPLLVYAWLSAAEAAGVVDPAARPWCAALETMAGEGPSMATGGAAAASAAWAAVALRAGAEAFGVPAWAERAAATFARLAAQQQASGAFLSATPADNPEVHWYHELVVLHAAADYAVRTGDDVVAVAVDRNAAFHLAETEPDHATGQPWGLPAFVRGGETGSVADVLLHAVSAHHPAGPTGLTLFLLADTLYGLRPRPEDRP